MKIAALNRIEVRFFWQVAMYAKHGYRVKHYPRGNKTFMVRSC